MRLEEIAQLVVGDIRDEGANGSTVTIIDIPQRRQQRSEKCRLRPRRAGS
jgi:hypothetical protein